MWHGHSDGYGDNTQRCTWCYVDNIQGTCCIHTDNIPWYWVPLCWQHSRVAIAVMLTSFQGGNCSYVDIIPGWQLQLCWQYSMTDNTIALTVTPGNIPRQHSKTTGATRLLRIHSRLIIFHTKSHRYVIHDTQQQNTQFLHHLEEREYCMRSVCTIRDTAGSGEICSRHSHLHFEGVAAHASKYGCGRHLVSSPPCQEEWDIACIS